MKRLFGLTLLVLALAGMPAQAQQIKITTGTNNKPALGPWYLYWPMEAHFQTPASPYYPYWPAPMGLPNQVAGGQQGGYAPYGTPGTDELPESIRALVRCSDTLVMQNHGSVTLGSNLLDAFKKLDMLEHTAKILWLANCVGTVKPLPPEAVMKLLGTRAKLGIKSVNTLENQCGLPKR